MPHKFTFVLLFVTGLSFAQLSVRNNAYIFVNDQVVFVENDINLNEATSTIYLRNEAQLIQGSGTETAAVKNSGIGELSVYQDGNVGAHEYNYWCSPVGSKTASTTNNPFGITLLHDIDPFDITGTLATTYVHNSNYNGTSSPLNIEPYWIWKLIAQSGYFDWIHVQAATTINPGEGFTMKGTAGTSANNPGDNQNYDFRGKPNTGTIEVAVATRELSLVGNPYPSAIDAHAYIWDNDNRNTILPQLEFWEQDPNVNSHILVNYSGGYATYTIDEFSHVRSYTPATFSTYDAAGNLIGGGSGSPSGKEPQRYIPIGQGFMVTGVANGVVRAKNAHRVYQKESGANSEFFKNPNTKEKTKTEKTANGFYKVPSDFKRFRLNIDFNNTHTRQLLENFHARATLGYDPGLEGKMNTDNILASDAYFTNNEDNDLYVIQALPFDASLKIPLTIKLAQNMPVRIRIADIQNFDSNQPIYIHDK
ncbi:secretion protein [Gelatiniphilus marinus]|uniref:Secretion protein n=1 Tax=Gelatiniphilus marinus TaxID=1759464 RepID=A0ABW5JSM9_9FLAO